MPPRSFTRARAFVGGVALVLGVTLATAGAGRWSAQKGDEPPHARRRGSVTQEDQRLFADTELWNRTVYFNQVQAWNDAAWAHGLELLAFYYVPPAPPPVRRVPVSRPSSGATVGGACGGSRFDYVIDEESGGNPNARNASGAWGCYQIMPATWAGAGCEGAHGSASVAQQAACADRLSASAWAASQG
jgi:hypothetical protein